MLNESPNCCHLPSFFGGPVRSTPSISIPARLLGGILLRVNDDDVVLLTPRTPPSVLNEGIVEPVVNPTFRTRIEGRPTTMKKNVQLTRRDRHTTVTSFAALWNIHITGIGERHVGAAFIQHPKRLLVKGKDTITVNGATVLWLVQSAVVDVLQCFAGTIVVAGFQPVHCVWCVRAWTVKLCAAGCSSFQCGDTVKRWNIIDKLDLRTRVISKVRKKLCCLLHHSLGVTCIFGTSVHEGSRRR
mmetsp:Transcript_15924/g.31229  ORF Transcript_15924/g.31229 Transcript_15924/m.31229 type:complete len:243 (+) Transcript_15924:115-843(+)